MSEARLQMSVKQYLVWCLPEDIFWTASSAGVNLGATKAQRLRNGSKSKALGVRKGLPDLLFVMPVGITRYIELKIKGGSLKPEQKTFRDLCQASGKDVWALCRSVDEVEAVLRRWGVEMKNHPFKLATWDDKDHEPRFATWADAEDAA